MPRIAAPLLVVLLAVLAHAGAATRAPAGVHADASHVTREVATLQSAPAAAALVAPGQPTLFGAERCTRERGERRTCGSDDAAAASRVMLRGRAVLIEQRSSRFTHRTAHRRAGLTAWRTATPPPVIAHS